MNKKKLFLGLAALGLVAGAYFTRDMWIGNENAARVQGPPARVVPVEVATAVRKKTPVRLNVLGTVTPMASVALKTRLDSEIVGVHFADGASVKQGDLLFTLDCRQIEADMKRVQAVIDGAQASFEQSQRDVARYEDLASRNATPIVTLNNAKTSVNVSKATAEANTAQLENLKVQRGFCSIKAPISGRVSTANVKVGNFARSADVTPMATIIQISPIYISFAVPQKNLPDIRQAIAAETATVEANIPGDARRASGAVTVIENTVDATTGMATVRATMPNSDELLWPGTLVNVELTLRQEDGVVVPTSAVQINQSGNFVFVVKGGAVAMQQVTVERQVAGDTVIRTGLQGGETVVIDGQLQLANGTRVAPRPNRTAAGS